MTGAYSSLKAAYHTEDIEDLRHGVRIVPRHVHFIISDFCNQDCHFCAYRMSGGFSTEQFGENGNKNPFRMIPKDKCLEILQDCWDLGVQAVQFTGGGEPTVHSDHREIMRFAQDLGLKTALVTNGVAIKPDSCFERMEWIRVSLDAGREETYERVRKSRGWKRALRNLEYLAGLDGPLLGVGFVVTRENYTEIGQACEIARGVGAKNIRIAAMFSKDGSGYYGGLRKEICANIDKARDCERDGFRVVDLFSRRLDDLDKGSPENAFCGYQFFTVYIGGDQKVYRCCTTSYTAHGEVGDLSRQTFKGWYMASEDKYWGFDGRSCHHCQFNTQNEVINYLMTEPPHADFV